MIARFNGNVVPFADDATSTNRTVFGGVTQSDLIDDNLNADFKKGWEIVGLNDNPTREDFNAMGYTLGALTAYLYEIGISEWNTSQNYRVNSRVIGSDGKIYKAKTGTDLAPNVNNNPTTDTTNWEIDIQFDINSLTAKTTPVDTDNLAIQETGGLLKKLSWANLKAALKTYFDTLYNLYNPTPIIATGTATFTATTNNINLTGIGVGVEIGDVIQISGADDAKNNSEFTIEVITDANNIIVNQAHANKSTTKNVATRASDTGVTVKLLAKWYNASDSLGQDWIDVTPSRSNNTNYQNSTKRAIELNITVTQNAGIDQKSYLYSGSSAIGYSGAGGGASAVVFIPINATAVTGTTYRVNSTGNIVTWYEKR